MVIERGLQILTPTPNVLFIYFYFNLVYLMIYNLQMKEGNIILIKKITDHIRDRSKIDISLLMLKNKSHWDPLSHHPDNTIETF